MTSSDKNPYESPTRETARGESHQPQREIGPFSALFVIAVFVVVLPIAGGTTCYAGVMVLPGGSSLDSPEVMVLSVFSLIVATAVAIGFARAVYLMLSREVLEDDE